MTLAQSVPVPQDYADYDVEVVSAELPCGAAWLANCLLELNVPIWNPWWFDTRDEWQRLAPYRFRYVAEHMPWRQTLPALKVGQEFQFVNQPVPRFSHCWPHELPSDRPVALFVRDPRDALYSEWRRQLRHDVIPADRSFEVFVEGRFHHHPFSFADYLVRYLDTWREALAGRAFLIVRFEDYESAADATLGRACHWLGLETSLERREIAAARSDYGVVKQIEDELEAKGQLQRQWNRRGMAFEYRTTYTDSMREAVGRRFDSINDWLGYQTAR